MQGWVLQNSPEFYGEAEVHRDWSKSNSILWHLNYHLVLHTFVFVDLSKVVHIYLKAVWSQHSPIFCFLHNIMHVCQMRIQFQGSDEASPVQPKLRLLTVEKPAWSRSKILSPRKLTRSMWAGQWKWETFDPPTIPHINYAVWNFCVLSLNYLEG